MLFKINDTDHGNDKDIFARGVHHAAEIFVAWQMANDVPIGNFTIERVTLESRTSTAAAHLREALSLGIDGVGSYDAAVGWKIRPVGDDRPVPHWL